MIVITQLFYRNMPAAGFGLPKVMFEVMSATGAGVDHPLGAGTLDALAALNNPNVQAWGEVIGAANVRVLNHEWILALVDYIGAPPPAPHMTELVGGAVIGDTITALRNALNQIHDHPGAIADMFGTSGAFLYPGNAGCTAFNPNIHWPTYDGNNPGIYSNEFPPLTEAAQALAADGVYLKCAGAAISGYTKDMGSPAATANRFESLVDCQLVAANAGTGGKPSIIYLSWSIDGIDRSDRSSRFDRASWRAILTRLVAMKAAGKNFVAVVPYGGYGEGPAFGSSQAPDYMTWSEELDRPYLDDMFEILDPPGPPPLAAGPRGAQRFADPQMRGGAPDDVDAWSRVRHAITRIVNTVKKKKVRGR